jgi:hypothetical protein
MLSSGPAKVYKHAVLISCAMHHAQFNEAVLILNFLGLWPCENFRDMFHVSIEHYSRSFYGMEVYFVA